MLAEDEAAALKCLNPWLIYHRGWMQSCSAAPAAWGHAPEGQMVTRSWEAWEQMLGRTHPPPPPQSSATDFQPGGPGGRLPVPRRADAAGNSLAPPSHLRPGS